MKNEFDSFSAVVPSYDEAKRFPKVINELLKICFLKEVILVDDGSTDNTSDVAKQFEFEPRFIYVCHKKNHGKGAALKTGVDKAKSEVILFLDADLENITDEKIKRIVNPVLSGEVDVARGAFRRRRGRVTEYAVKPMMQILFPGMYFEQPISGQICAKKSFLTSVDFESRYGVDIGLLFDAIESGQRIIEVNIGRLIHKANEEDVIGEMSRQVLETMIKKAGLIQHKYKLVIFTLDDTLIAKDSMGTVFRKLGINAEVQKNRRLLNSGKITNGELLKRNAKKLAGLSTEQVFDACSTLVIANYAPEVINALKKRKYQVGIVSSNFSPIANCVAKKLGVENVESVGLVSKNDVFSGEITESSIKKWTESSIEDSYKHAFNRMIKKCKVKSSEVVTVASVDKAAPLMVTSGLSIAYKPKSFLLKSLADKTISVHAEILAIIE